jgi:hypothetical protein
MAKPPMLSVYLTDLVHLGLSAAVERTVALSGKLDEIFLELDTGRIRSDSSASGPTETECTTLPKRHGVSVDKPFDALDDRFADPFDLVKVEQPVEQDECSRGVVKLTENALRTLTPRHH